VESNETENNNKSKSPIKEKAKNKEQTLDTSDLLIENALLDNGGSRFMLNRQCTHRHLDRCRHVVFASWSKSVGNVLKEVLNERIGLFSPVEIRIRKHKPTCQDQR
jgi:hypothetical protein